MEEMAEREREIEVRSLSGESTTVSISENKTIEDLKLLLIQTFPPASNSPNFHLFFKGAKLSLQSKLNSHPIGSGKFMVLVPFTKKVRQCNQSATTSEVPNQSPVSNFADSAWSDMMQDLRTLSNMSNNENQTNFDSGSVIEGVRNELMEEASATYTLERKRKKFHGDKQEGSSDDLILSLLKSPCKIFLDKQNCEILIRVLESVNCLLDMRSGSCMLLREVGLAYGDATQSGSKSSLCLCPAWLKKIMKTFTFLNIFSAFLQLQQGHITLIHLKEGLDHLGEFGFQVDMEDIEHLSVLCPKRKNGNEMAMLFSLEDLLISVKEGGAGKAKQARRSWSAVSSTNSAQSKCHDTNPLLPMEMVEHLRKGMGCQGQMVHVEEICARMAIRVEIPDELSENTKSALEHIGVTRLYSHQAESIQASLGGKNVVVATMTSSGKSLCYNVPVLEVLSQNLLSCALYLFPTKALAQDQLRALLAMTKGSDVSLKMGVYDGDTSEEDRMWLRDNARLLITNPDMLHMSILPFHGQFRRILSNLRFVIIDEAHAYKGAFGCHTAFILRRLRRLCHHVYGSDPSFIFCTATSANPRDHAMELANLPTLELIHNDGSPSGPKFFALWNPALCSKTVSKRSTSSTNISKSADENVIVKRSSPIWEISCLFAEMIQHGLRCIAFCKSRKLCELVLSYTREILQETAPHLVDSICAYRAGYVAQDRRRIESDFFSGKLCGIAATNALELGIDVGHIDVTLHLGFPGSIASLWQQAGRSGRRERPSLAIYVAFEGPLDQYFMKFPQKLFRRPIECCHVDAQNQQVLEQHLVCAALEHPLSLLYDEKYFGSGLNSAITSLTNRGYLSFDPSRGSSSRIWNYIGHAKIPSHAVSIRAIETEKYKVIDKGRDELLEEIEESKAFFQVYDGAVYMHQGKTYLVKELDISRKLALCQQADLKYYTKTRDYTDIHVIGGEIAYQARISRIQFARTTAQVHDCRVTTTWFGFRRIWKGSNKVFDTVELSLPTYSYQSQAVWVRVPQSVKTAVEIHRFSFRAGLHAASHAVLNVVPLYVICNSSDLAPECSNPHDTRYIPERILLYDPHPGGTGFSAQVRSHFTELLTAALELLMSCCCTGDTGCPNCIQNLACGEYNELLHKDAAIMIIKGVLEAEESYFGGHTDSSKP
eukprot:XP_019082187.1 PREDICTED: uncharacterized protein LOC100257644 isoform X3 [Vitis vinifera]